MTMRLSDAIRLGAMWKPQAFEGPGTARLKDKVRTCALAAAAEAVGEEKLNTYPSGIWMGAWGWTMDYVKCPACPSELMCLSVTNVIAHLNDGHHWTREAIADWVAGLEAARESVVSEPLLEVLA